MKKWWKSKSINFGLLLAMMGVVQIYVDTFQDPRFTMIAGLVVVYLRFKTSQPIGNDDA